MFDQLGRIDVGNNNWSVERLINAPHRLDWTLRTHTDHYAVWLHEILHRKPFAEKFRIAHHVKFHTGFAVALDCFGNFIAGFYGNGALIDHDFVAGHRLSHLSRNRFHET